MSEKDNKASRMNKYIRFIDWALIIILIAVVLWAKYTGKYDTYIVQCDYLRPADGNMTDFINNITRAFNITR